MADNKEKLVDQEKEKLVEQKEEKIAEERQKIDTFADFETNKAYYGSVD